MNNLKKARIASNMSTKQVAEIIGYSQKQVENFENGRNQANHQTLIKLSKLYNCTIDYLLQNEDGITITKQEFLELIKIKKIIEKIEKRNLEITNQKPEQYKIENSFNNSTNTNINIGNKNK